MVANTSRISFNSHEQHDMQIQILQDVYTESNGTHKMTGDTISGNVRRWFDCKGFHDEGDIAHAYRGYKQSRSDGTEQDWVECIC